MLASAKGTVDDIGHLLKGKEADSQRQQNLLQVEIRMEGQIHIFDKEIIVFEVKQNAQIYKQSGKQADSSGLGKL